MKINWKDVGIHSLKTFIKVLPTYAGPTPGGIRYGNGTVSDTVRIGILFRGLCAGITAVINGVILPLFRAGE